LNKASGVAARNGTTSHTIPFGFTAGTGNKLVFIVSGAVTHTITGWNERQQPVNSGETSLFELASTAGETSVTVVHNGSNYPVAWWVMELPAASTYVTSSGNAANNTTFTALTGMTAASKIIIAALGCNGTLSSTGCSAAWTGMTEDMDSFTPRPTVGDTDGCYLTVAYLEGSTATSYTPAGTFTISAPGVGDREKLAAAYTL
jgi:hypothetical protein